jgi:hypothetical protein
MLYAEQWRSLFRFAYSVLRAFRNRLIFHAVCWAIAQSFPPFLLYFESNLVIISSFMLPLTHFIIGLKEMTAKDS